MSFIRVLQNDICNTRDSSILGPPNSRTQRELKISRPTTDWKISRSTNRLDDRLASTPSHSKSLGHAIKFRKLHCHVDSHSKGGGGGSFKSGFKGQCGVSLVVSAGVMWRELKGGQKHRPVPRHYHQRGKLSKIKIKANKTKKSGKIKVNKWKK